jgi:hypothetical protein
MSRRKTKEPGPLADTPFQESFRTKLAAWREQAPGGRVTQAQLDKILGKEGRAYIGQVETGALPPPSREVCLALGKALGLRDPAEVWEAAAPALLERLDRSGELMEWHQQSLQLARQTDISHAALTIIIRLRELAVHLAGDIGESMEAHARTPESFIEECSFAEACLQEELHQLLQAIVAADNEAAGLVESEDPNEVGAPVDFYLLLRALGHLPVVKQARLLHRFRTIAFDTLRDVGSRARFFHTKDVEGFAKSVGAQAKALALDEPEALTVPFDALDFRAHVSARAILLDQAGYADTDGGGVIDQRPRRIRRLSARGSVAARLAGAQQERDEVERLAVHAEERAHRLEVEIEQLRRSGVADAEARIERLMEDVWVAHTDRDYARRLLYRITAEIQRLEGEQENVYDVDGSLASRVHVFDDSMELRDGKVVRRRDI